MDPNQRVSFMSMVENLDVTPGEPPAVVVNVEQERWLLVVMSGLQQQLLPMVR